MALVLNLEPGKWIQIGTDIFVKVPDAQRHATGLVIDAPRSVPILRQKLVEQQHASREAHAAACGAR